MINQAVLFTKPVHHLGLHLTAEELGRRARTFFEAHDFSIIKHHAVAGPELTEREVIREHYLIYSRASFGEFGITEAGRETFFECYRKCWDEEVAAGRILSNPRLMKEYVVDADQLFVLWNAAEVHKLQTGVLIAWLDALGCYCINAFYPAMESNFYHPKTRMDYFVIEFDPSVVSWRQFRKEVLGSTNAAKAATSSFRGTLYAQFPVQFPGRDNFVHGSAGPLEGLIERSVHEPDFEFSSNPIGRHLQALGVTLDQFYEWKAHQPNAAFGALFDVSEELDTDAVFPVLERIAFV